MPFTTRHLRRLRPSRPLLAAGRARLAAGPARLAASAALFLFAVACGRAPPAPRETAPAHSAAPAIQKTVDGVGLIPLSIEGFDALSPAERALAYYLTRAAIAGRDRSWNRDGGTVLELRDLLEEILTHPRAIEAPVRDAIHAYLERFWIHTGNHDAWSGRKFVPTFTPADLRAAAEAARQEGAEIRLALGETLDAKLARLGPVLFDAKYEPAVAPRPPTSHGGVTTRRTDNDRRQEAALRTLRGFLSKGAAFAPPDERASLERLGAALTGTDAGGFAAWSGEWIAGQRRIDLLTGPQPATPGRNALEPEAWYGIASIADPARERSMVALAAVAGDLLAASPGGAGAPAAPAPAPARASARALLASVGPGGPATPAAVPFPAAGGRGDGGFRALILTNVEAAADATVGRTIVATFAPEADRDRLEAARGEARFAFVALRALLGEAATGGGGAAARGAATRGAATRGASTQAAGEEGRAVLEAARADLLALHHAADPRLVTAGLFSATDRAEAVLPIYLAEALAGLRGASAEGVIEGIDRRAQHLVLRELLASNAVVRETSAGRTEIRVADPAAARSGVASLLERVEAALDAPGRSAPGRSTPDGGLAAWVARSGTSAEPELVAEIAGRAAAAGLPDRCAFLMPDVIPVRDAQGEVIDARVGPAADFTLQMLRYSGKLPFEAPR